MPARIPDPYRTLGVSSRASDAEIRSAYRRLVQLHHPDHNGGSAESARRFEAVQDAYAQIRQLRGSGGGAGAGQSPRAGAGQGAGQAPPRPRASGRATPPPAPDPEMESRLAAMERELREAHLARERARQAAREAAAENADRPSDEELGYVTTDDTFSKILADARSEISGRLSQAREHPVTKRVVDDLEDLMAKLTGDSPPRRPPD